MSELPALQALLDQIVERVARRVVALQEETHQGEEDGAGRSPWMSAKSTASYLDWRVQRLYKLTASGEIPHYKQEGRLLFHRGELERWLAGFAEGARRLDRFAETELSSRPDQKGAASQ
jgi:excisionase family DNA binding protein